MISVDLLQDRRLGVFADRAHLSSQLQRLRVFEAQVQFLLQRICVLMSADANVAGEERRRTLARC